MFSDILRIIVWLAAFAALLFLLPALNVYSGREFFWILGIVAVLGVVVTSNFLAGSIIVAGANTQAAQRGSTSVHRLGWGAIFFLGAVSIGFGALFLDASHGTETFSRRALSILIIAGCIYLFVSVLLYRVICSDRQIMARNWYLGWDRHEWDDLGSISRKGPSRWAFDFGRTGILVVPTGITGLEHLLTVANEALVRNNRAMGTDDA